MGAVSTGQMRAMEAAALKEGWTEETLMNLAGERLGRALAFHFPTPGTAIGYLGKGHNTGDTLIALRILRDHYGWKIHTRESYPLDQLTPLAHRKYAELGTDFRLDHVPPWQDLDAPLLLLDGLLGIGGSGALRPPLLEQANEMAWLRNHTAATIAAVDLPSGTDPDSGERFSGSLKADITFMIGAPKQGLLYAHAASAVGKLALVSVEPLQASNTAEMELICPQNCNFARTPRPFDFHKGQAGRLTIVAGSEDYQGAAVMAATGALRGGAGLITLLVPSSARDAISQRCPPEIIVRGMDSPLEALDLKHDAMVIGCGIGTIPSTAIEQWLELIRKGDKPTVLDADVLNLIASTSHTDLFAAHHILTPHPGEFARLAPKLKELPREEAAKAYSRPHPSTLLLKGSRTIVTQAGHPLWINSTGSPGMATGGQGDLLAGVLGAGLASGLSPLHAACHAAWLCGRAAEHALLMPRISEESLTPSDVALHLGAAFHDWRNQRR